MKSTIIATAMVLGLASSATATTLTDAFSSFWVLGDSLSDNGNLFAATGGFPPPPYADGQFSNGDVWNQAIIDEFEAAGQTDLVTPFGSFEGNLAYGGARTSGVNTSNPIIPGVDQQAGILAAFGAPQLGPRPLISLWGGANNIFQDLGAIDAATIGQNAADDLMNYVFGLNSVGAQDFLVFNLPDIGLSPDFLGGPAQGLATTASGAFNTRLATNIGILEGAGINIIDINIAQIFVDFTGDPAGAGFANVTDQCIMNLLNGLCDPNTWLFWDGVHPTARVHADIQGIVRTRIAEELSTVPLPASGVLLIFGFGALAMMRRRTA